MRIPHVPFSYSLYYKISGQMPLTFVGYFCQIKILFSTSLHESVILGSNWIWIKKTFELTQCLMLAPTDSPMHIGEVTIEFKSSTKKLNTAVNIKPNSRKFNTSHVTKTSWHFLNLHLSCIMEFTTLTQRLLL